MSTDGDDVVAAQDVVLVATRPWFRRRGALLLLALGVVALSLAAGLGLHLLFGGAPEGQPAQDAGRAGLRELVGLGTSVVGWLMFLIGSVTRVGSLRRSRPCPVRDTSRAERRRISHQLRGRLPVPDDEVPLVRQAGISSLARLRSARLSFSGLGLVFAGQVVAAGSALLALPWVLLLVGLCVGVVLGARETRRARTFLTAHPGPS